VKRTSTSSIFLALLFVWCPVASAHPHQQQVPADPFLWLEDVNSKRSLDWVTAHNAATVAALTSAPEYPALYENIKRALDSQDKVAYPQMVGDRVYNFWQDANHQRGLWRRATWDSYLKGTPKWETVLDVDSLATAEAVAWSFVGAQCLEPENRVCIMELSRAGADSTEVRAINVVTGKFVPLESTLPDPRVRASRVARNELPYIRAGENRSLDPALDGIEQRVPQLSLLAGNTNARMVKLHAPADADVYMVLDQVIVYVHEPWNVGGTTWEPGSIVATSVGDFLTAKRNLKLVMRPGQRETIESISATRDYLLLDVLNNVCGELRRYRHTNGGWTVENIRVPAMGSVDVISTSATSNRFFFSYTSFLQPTTLYLADDDGKLTEVKRLPATYDAKDLTVEQMEATSKDGTRIPFFIVHRESLPRDGRNPTLLYAYGGFELSSTPGYGTATGPAWIARGGVYVVANIRGGGEFGPEWHRAGVRENRQRVYDDFTAVAEELIRQRITSPEHLGIMGSSNGGLLTGVALTERPDLYKGVVIQSALLDMQRYSHLLGGSTWIAEYGDPDKPEEWAYISKYSPYQNLKANTKYPEVLFTTSTLDDRVHPGHVRKMAAKMESMGQRIYYFENTAGGHGNGQTNEQRARTLALTYAYLWQQLSGGPHM